MLKPEESTAKSVSTVLRGKLLTLGTLLYRRRMHAILVYIEVVYIIVL